MSANRTENSVLPGGSSRFFYRHGLDDDKTQASVVHLDLVLAGFGCFLITVFSKSGE